MNKLQNRQLFAVIDTETNWADEVMSIGVVISDDVHFQPLDARYYILPEPCRLGGMYSHVLTIPTPVRPVYASRPQVMQELAAWLAGAQVERLFAYNALFDSRHLPELAAFSWHDIMRLAIYRQYNRKIPPQAECCATGRLKRNYGVEPIFRLLSGNCRYRETHNACHDALDELKIMGYLGYQAASYPPLGK